jgi:hypothetical protein
MTRSVRLYTLLLLLQIEERIKIHSLKTQIMPQFRSAGKGFLVDKVALGKCYVLSLRFLAAWYQSTSDPHSSVKRGSKCCAPTQICLMYGRKMQLNSSI